jgi:hypothetical protein
MDVLQNLLCGWSKNGDNYRYLAIRGNKAEAKMDLSDLKFLILNFE